MRLAAALLLAGSILLAPARLETAGPGSALEQRQSVGSRPAPPAEIAGRPERGSELTVYLLTMGPGDLVWERFGHNAILIRDAARGTSLTYNWGMFDFADSDFLPRFIMGEMRYWMGAFELAPTLDLYRERNRSVWVQELNLAPSQRADLLEFVEWNALPENRYYSYDYYRDNCSTRVRDVIDRFTGGALRQALSGSPSGTTYRFHTRRLTEVDPLIYAGTLVGLGRPVDRPISKWEEDFLPMALRQHLREVRVREPGGAAAPLVLSESVLFQADRAPEAAAPRSHALWFGLAGAALLAAFLMLGARARAGSYRVRAGLIAVATVWSLLAGMLGVLLSFLWIFTSHVYSYNNENLLQVNPLSLVLAVLLIASLGRRQPAGPMLARSAALKDVSVAIALAALLGLALKLAAGADQVNWEVIALTLPAHAGLAIALSLLAPIAGRDRGMTAQSAADRE